MLSQDCIPKFFPKICTLLSKLTFSITSYFEQ
uniref:Uncharacterized protein n=1 Tax=Anguilla anguilla TaxID=7936 RepID=A0A0E9Q3E3_ANGAN